MSKTKLSVLSPVWLLLVIPLLPVEGRSAPAGT